MDMRDNDPYERRGRRVRVTGIVASLIILVILLCIVLYLLFSDEEVPSPREIISDYKIEDKSQRGSENPDDEIVEDSENSTSFSASEIEVGNESEELFSGEGDLASSEMIALEEEPQREEYPQVDFSVYRVGESESLLSIASKFSLPKESIMSVNNLMGDTLRNSQVLLIPSIPILQYVVMEDESIESIIEKERLEMSVEEIADLNGIDENSTFKIGDILYIPYVERIKDDEILDYVIPLEGEVLYLFGSNFGARILDGIIIKGEDGDEVLSPLGGFVSSKGEDRSLGSYISIDLDNLMNIYFYGLESIEVDVGDEVERGERIGRVGSSYYGLLPSALYLVLEKNGSFIDPLEID